MALVHYVSAVAAVRLFHFVRHLAVSKSSVPLRRDRPAGQAVARRHLPACGILMILAVLWAASSMFTHAPVFLPSRSPSRVRGVLVDEGEAYKPVMQMVRSPAREMRPLLRRRAALAAAHHYRDRLRASDSVQRFT